MSEFFYQSVDISNRAAMIAFLTGHFRYNTMNSWNMSTSYANNVKLNRLQIPDELSDKAYEVIFAEEQAVEWQMFWRRIADEFQEKTGYRIGTNGHSGGYIVLYHAEYPGRSLDMNEDFEDWDDDQLRDRVHLVQTFDRACDTIRDGFLTMLTNSDVEDAEIVIRRPVKAVVVNDVSALDDLSL